MISGCMSKKKAKEIKIEDYAHWFRKENHYYSNETDDVKLLQDTINKLQEMTDKNLEAYLDTEEGLGVRWYTEVDDKEKLKIVHEQINYLVNGDNEFKSELKRLYTKQTDLLTAIKGYELVARRYEELEEAKEKRELLESQTFQKYLSNLTPKYFGERPAFFASGDPRTTKLFDEAYKLTRKELNIGYVSG